MNIMCSHSVMSGAVKCSSPARRFDWLLADWQLRLTVLLIGFSMLRGVAAAPSNPCGARPELERMRLAEEGVHETTGLERVRTKLKISLDHWTSLQHNVDNLYGKLHERMVPSIKWLPSKQDTVNAFKKAKCKKKHRLNLLHTLYNDLELFVRCFRAVTKFPPNNVEVDRKKHYNRKSLSTRFKQEANGLLCEVTEALQEYNMTIPDDKSALPLDWEPNPNHTIAMVQGSAVIHSYKQFLEVWLPIVDALVKPPVKCQKNRNRNRQRKNRKQRKPPTSTPRPR